MAIFRDSSNLPLWVRVAPLESHSAAVLISDPAWKCLPDQQVLSSLFGLTRTECRLASLLMQGASLLKAARELNVTHNRARTHLRVLFRKTGAKSNSRPGAGFGCTGRNSNATASIATGPAAVTQKAVRQPQLSATSCETRNDKPTPKEKLEV